MEEITPALILLREAASFSSLPEQCPYGFVIYRDGNFDIAQSMWSHGSLLKVRYPGVTQENLKDALDDGCIAVRAGVNVDTKDGRLVVDTERRLLATATTPSSKARKTLKDLGSWYSLPVLLKKL